MRSASRLAIFISLALPVAATAQYVDTTGYTPVHGQASLYGLLLIPHNPFWLGDSLTCEAVSLDGPSLGVELMLRYRSSWLFGLSVGSCHAYTDAIHARSSIASSNTEWTVHGERMGLDQRFLMAGPQVDWEPWHYPRRHKVGMTLLLGAGIYYMHFKEECYALPDGVAEGTSAWGGKFYSYDTHDDLQVLGSSSGSGVCGQLWFRVVLHLGKRISLYSEFGILRSTAVKADGASYTTPQGTVLTIAPHSADPGRVSLRNGLAVYF
ncbi:MAG TPA: hypothetical protein VKG92_09960 [Flavobacteriales bacterium]|nr:hypothetical protein [Flavobacteriales bacterium]